MLDTNVLIEILKNNQHTIKQVSALTPPLAISSITAMELMVGARNKKEIRLLTQFIAKFLIIHFDPVISHRALKLITRFAKSHGLDIPDALISATALNKKAQLFTYNSKDFQYIPDLELMA
ncbi:MAG: type II toxin-antitoxin system VapC family toxin [Xanthomonadales bacterium]|nr:type II toxin-antitoxin system VapC family toxin [Xanthomonadales bacterium]